MTNSEFIKLVLSKNPGMFQDDVRKIVKFVFTNIKEAIETGESILIPGVGTIYLQFKEGKTGWRNPFTGEVKDVEGKVKLRFRPNKRLQDHLTETMRDMFETGSVDLDYNIDEESLSV